MKDGVRADAPPLGAKAPSGLKPAALDVPGHIGTERRVPATGMGLCRAIHAVASPQRAGSEERTGATL